MDKLRKRGRRVRLLRKQITCADPATSRTLRPNGTKKQYQALSDLENQTGADIHKANSVCFIKSRSMKHTEVLLRGRSDDKTLEKE